MKKIRDDNMFLQCADLILPYLPLPSLASAAATCSYLRRLSIDVTSRRRSDASRTFEEHPIPFINPSVSPCPPYSYFLYTPSSLSNPPKSQSWGGLGSSSFPPEPDTGDLGIGSGCECLSDCDPNGCPCWPLRFECGRSCGCGLACGNRATQEGISVRLKIVRDLKKGWGLHVAEFVKEGEFICEYAVISSKTSVGVYPLEEEEDRTIKESSCITILRVSMKLSSSGRDRVLVLRAINISNYCSGLRPDNELDIILEWDTHCEVSLELSMAECMDRLQLLRSDLLV